jgi:hypothetical protein
MYFLLSSIGAFFNVALIVVLISFSSVSQY